MRPIIFSLLMLSGLHFCFFSPALAGESLLGQVESSKIASTEGGLWASMLNLLRGRGKIASEGDLVVKVLDTSGLPLAGATVLVGQQAGDPFPGNQAVTDSSGTAIFFDDSLKSGTPYTVTASLAGRTTVSLLENRDNSVQIKLQRNQEERGYGFLRGKLQGFPSGIGSGSLEMGFFLPAARPEALVNFDVQSFVSSYKVKIDIYGEREVPGNVVMPTQSKFYGFFPISVSKPEYIMPLPTGMVAHMYGLLGSVPIDAAMSAFQKKDFLAVLNLAKLTNVGWTRDRVEVRGNDNFDLTAGQRITPAAVTAQISGLQMKADAIAITLFDPKGDRGDYVSMDIKSLKSENMQNGGGSIRLGMLRQPNSPNDFYVFTALFDKTQVQGNAHWIVGSVQPVQKRAAVPFTSYFNPIRSLGVGANNREFHFSSPATAQLVPEMLLINIVSEKKNAETHGVTRTVLWSAVVRGSADKIILPDLGRPVLPAPDTTKGEKFHWEVSALRSSGAAQSGFNLQESLRNLQDVSSLSQPF